VRLDVVDGRRVWRYLPPAAPEVLLLLLDGREYTTLAPIQNVLDNLLAEGLIPPTAAVPDAPEAEGRFRDLGMNRGVPRGAARPCSPERVRRAARADDCRRLQHGQAGIALLRTGAA
jgi:enterochelin esterase family protein